MLTSFVIIFTLFSNPAQIPSHWICTQSGAGVRPTCTLVNVYGDVMPGTSVVTTQK